MSLDESSSNQVVGLLSYQRESTKKHEKERLSRSSWEPCSFSRLVDGLWTPRVRRDPPSRLLECTISTVGKRHERNSIGQPFDHIPAVNECSSPPERPHPTLLKAAARRYLLVARLLTEAQTRLTLKASQPPLTRSTRSRCDSTPKRLWDLLRSP